MHTLRRLGLVALFLGFVQVVFGAIVRITGSGLGCGDRWPDCYGSFTPAQGFRPMRPSAMAAFMMRLSTMTCRGLSR